MLVLLESPEIGKAVSNGVFGANCAGSPNGAGFVWAKNGALPVLVGPESELVGQDIMHGSRTWIGVCGRLKIIWNR